MKNADLEPDNFTNPLPDPDDPFAPLPTEVADPQAACQRRRRRRHILLGSAGFLALALAVAVGLRYFVPYATESRVRGFVTNVERRGLLFKTFEGEMITNEMLTDTTRIYQRSVTFSVPDDSLARELQQRQSTGRPVILLTKRYHGSLPWRGASTTIVTDIIE